MARLVDNTYIVCRVGDGTHIRQVKSQFFNKDKDKFVTSFDNLKRKPFPAKIESIKKIKDECLIRIKLHAGKELVCSIDTELLVKGEFKKAGNLMLEDSIGCARNTRIWYSAIESISGPEPGSGSIYEVILNERSLGFIANGIIVR